jgi:hypothetical protein
MPLHPLHCDVLFVGGGFRTTTFLASNPALFGYRICVVEQECVLGPGSYGRFTAQSSSDGRSFFRYVDRDGPFGWIYNDSIIGMVANSRTPVSLQLLSNALARLGEVITTELGKGQILLGDRVSYVDISPDNDYQVMAQTSNGHVIRARLCVFGTGRCERLHTVAKPFQEKVWLSSMLLASDHRDRLCDCLRDLSAGLIVVLGCSHSAFSSVALLLDSIKSVAERLSNYVDPRIIIVQRRAVRLNYASVAQARGEQIEGREEMLDPVRDVCPDTGIVFRDSGLRHRSRDLYCAIWRGDYPSVELQRIRDLDECHSLLNRADLIVQALGYQGRTPEIRMSGTCVRSADAATRLNVDDNGFVILDGDRSCRYIATVRVEPTPPTARDSGAYAKDLYHQLAKRIITYLSPGSIGLVAYGFIGLGAGMILDSV